MNQPESPHRFVVRRLVDDEVERVGAVLGLARLYQGNGFYLVAWENEEPLGHAYLALTDPPELQDVQVRPEQRRRGVASAMTFSRGTPSTSISWPHIRSLTCIRNSRADRPSITFPAHLAKPTRTALRGHPLGTRFGVFP